MDLTNVVAISKSRYVIHNLEDLKTVAKFATPGVRVLCLSNSKKYVMMNTNQWAEIANNGSGGGSSQDDPTPGVINNQVVNELPATGDEGVIYLVPSDEAEEQNIYNEYMYINNQWEQIGSTDIDFNAIQKEYIDSLFDDGDVEYSYQFKSNIVDELPITGLPNVIYLVPINDPEEGNIYEEWIYINQKWEKLGTTEKIDAIPFNNVEDLLH